MKRVVRNAAALFVLSWLTAHAGAWLGARFLPRGDGYPKVGEVQRDFFRFDSVYYLDIAENGYRYDGDPAASPNIVFAPLFPALVDAVPFVDAVAAGFAINALLFFASLIALTLLLEDFFTPRATFTILFALGTSAGAYALHAYYAESTMLACLAFALLAWRRGWWLTLGLASAALGASRLAALPISLAFTLILLLRRQPAAVLAPLGSALYLGYLGYRFGEPFSLISLIQKTSWGRFHPEVDWLAALDGEYLFTHFTNALAKGPATLFDIQTLNLVWLSLALFSLAAFFTRLRPLVLPFVPYVILVYATSIASPDLISLHRFCVVLVPLFALGACLHVWLARRAHPALACAVTTGLVVINLAYGLLHAALFNQGHWFWF